MKRKLILATILVILATTILIGILLNSQYTGSFHFNYEFGSDRHSIPLTIFAHVFIFGFMCLIMYGLLALIAVSIVYFFDRKKSKRDLIVSSEFNFIGPLCQGLAITVHTILAIKNISGVVIVWIPLLE